MVVFCDINGIRGIEYRDGTSRSSDKDVTYNYVVFDEADVKVVRVKDEQTGYEWQDYVDPTATFAIPARHASPHHGIRKFLMEFIGTGEGQQVYGHGLYFSTNESVHEFYNKQFNKTLKRQAQTPRYYDGKGNLVERDAAIYLDSEGNEIPLLEGLTVFWFTLIPPKSSSIKKWKETSKRQIERTLQKIRTTELPRQEADLKQWSLKEDSAEKERMIQMRNTVIQGMKKQIEQYEHVLKKLDLVERVTYSRPMQAAEYEVMLNFDRNGENLLRWDEELPDTLLEHFGLKRRHDLRNGEDLWHWLTDGEDGEAARDQLLHAGIKGIEYRDGTSRRSDKDVTYNYVLFDEADVKVVRVKDEQTGYEWQDYVDPTATFNIIGAKAATFQGLKDAGLTFFDRFETGVEKAEIDASQAEIRDTWGRTRGGKLSQILDYPDLYEAYPEFANMQIRIKSMPAGTNGSYNRLDNSINLNSSLLSKGDSNILDTLVHEIQHAIQEKEGFSPGTSASAGLRNRIVWLDYENNLLADLITKILRKRNRSAELEEHLQWLKSMQGHVQNEKSRLSNEYTNSSEGAYNFYHKTRGENEARNVTRRRTWSIEERDDTSFNSTLEYDGESEEARKTAGLWAGLKLELLRNEGIRLPSGLSAAASIFQQSSETGWQGADMGVGSPVFEGDNPAWGSVATAGFEHASRAIYGISERNWGYPFQAAAGTLQREKQHFRASSSSRIDNYRLTPRGSFSLATGRSLGKVSPRVQYMQNMIKAVEAAGGRWQALFASSEYSMQAPGFGRMAAQQMGGIMGLALKVYHERPRSKRKAELHQCAPCLCKA